MRNILCQIPICYLILITKQITVYCQTIVSLVDHFRAQTHCNKNYPSSLAVINSKEDDNKALKYCQQNYGYHCWIALYSDQCIYDYKQKQWVSDKYNFVWPGSIAPNYTNWCPCYPKPGVKGTQWNSTCDGGKFVYIDIAEGCWKNGYDGQFDYTWDAQWGKYPLCQQHIAYTRQPGTNVVTNNEKRNLVSKMSFWNEINVKCQQQGSHFISIHSKEEDDEIIEHCSSEYGYHCWIGLFSKGCQIEYNCNYALFASDEFIWVWSDGTDVNYTNWCDGYPKNGQEYGKSTRCDGGVFVYIDYDDKCWKNGYDGNDIYHLEEMYFKYGICRNYNDVAIIDGSSTEIVILIFVSVIMMILIAVVTVVYRLRRKLSKLKCTVEKMREKLQDKENTATATREGYNEYNYDHKEGTPSIHIVYGNED